MLNQIKLFLPIIFTWVIIIVVPIITGIIFSHFISIVYAIIFSIIIFIFLIYVGESLLQILKSIILKKTCIFQNDANKNQISDLIYFILIRSNICYSEIKPLLSKYSTDPVVNELIDILNQCVDNDTDKFNYIKVRYYQIRLNYIMNSLRE